MENNHRVYAIENLKSSAEEKNIFFVNNMHLNKSFKYFQSNNNLDKKKSALALELFKKKYLKYRDLWKKQPKNYFEKKKNSYEKLKILCIDVELASVCDLACPHCFRQHIATPDKIIKKKLAFNIIDQASDLNVPSMKFNWRGEPLLNPDIFEIIDYAKKKGIIETMINTNATKLNETNAKKLIQSGLDTLIYSFDGGSKETYEFYRPGRFKKNNFDEIHNNIKNFSNIKKNLNSVFPRTKIQMILTKETRDEKQEFLNLFKDYVDEISVKQYSERGGNIRDINIKNFVKDQKVLDFISSKKNADIMKNANDDYFLSTERLPCEQPFQRLLVSYDGRVSMCCYDWGIQHPVGFVDDYYFINNEKDSEEVSSRIIKKKTGFDLMKSNIPKKYNFPEKKIKKLKDIWNSDDINNIRKMHCNNKIGEVEICKNCSFKETYNWKKIEIN